jgi:ferritin-like metal-binding protein YciE
MPQHHDQILIRKLLTTVNDQVRQISELKQRLEQHREREKSQLEALAENANAINDIERQRFLLWQKEQ